MSNSDFEQSFLHSSADSHKILRDVLQEILQLIESWMQSKVYSGASLEELIKISESHSVAEEEGQSWNKIKQWIQGTLLPHSVNPAHSYYNAHLHCPPMIPSIVAELLISCLNQSMDSWDQAPLATLLETQVILWLAGLIGFDGKDADGVFTSGGTQSNFMAILLARNLFAEEKLSLDVSKEGVTEELRKVRIFCSELAHFSVEQAARIFGLGTQAVVKVPVDQSMRMDTGALESAIQDSLTRNEFPLLIVGTAGTTDFGSIDHIESLSALSRRYKMYLHIDACFASGLLFLKGSEREVLAKIEEADFVTVDFHKMLLQPIPCAAFLVKRKEYQRSLRVATDYLNPEEDFEAGIPHLVEKSLQTSRRFDALKIFLTAKRLGRDGLQKTVSRLLALAHFSAHELASRAHFVLATKPELSSVVFRYCPNEVDDTQVDSLNRINSAIKDQLFSSGEAVIGKTKVKGQTWLKFVLLNPLVQEDEICALIDRISEIGKIESNRLMRSES